MDYLHNQEQNRDMERRRVIHHAKAEASMVEKELQDILHSAPSSTTHLDRDISTQEILSKIQNYKGTSAIELSPPQQMTSPANLQRHDLQLPSQLAQIDFQRRMEEMQMMHRREIDAVQNQLMEDLGRKMTSFENACKDQYEGEIRELENTISSLRASHQENITLQTNSEISKLNEEILTKRLAQVNKNHDQEINDFKFQIAKLQSDADQVRYDMQKECAREVEESKRAQRLLESQLESTIQENHAHQNTIESLNSRVSSNMDKIQDLQEINKELANQLEVQRQQSAELFSYRDKLDEEQKMRYVLDSEYKKLVNEVGTIKSKVRRDTENLYNAQLRDQEATIERLTDQNSTLQSQNHDRAFYESYEQKYNTLEIRREVEHLLQNKKQLQIDIEQLQQRKNHSKHLKQTGNTAELEHWKDKASLLTSKYYDALKDLRGELLELREKAVRDVNTLHEDFDKTLENVIAHYTNALKDRTNRDTSSERRPRKKYIGKLI